MNSRHLKLPYDKPIRIFQANVGRGGPSHDTALALADRSGYDIVLIQEPFTTVLQNGECRTKTHTAYDTYGPVDHWDDKDDTTRPRVMTYLSRRGKLTADQIRPFQTRDILWIITGGLMVVNIYNDNKHTNNIDQLRHWPVPKRCFIGGDFNARHYTWQPGKGRNRGNAIAQWAEDNDLALLNQYAVPTNNHGNTIDLAFSNIPLAETVVEDHLATSSDHYTLSTTISLALKLSSTPTRRKVTDASRFKDYIDNNMTAIRITTGQGLTEATPECLEEVATALSQLLQDAILASSKQTRRHCRQAPWWTDCCDKAHRIYLAAVRNGVDEEVNKARQVFRNTIRAKKRQYWRDFVGNITRPEQIFRVTRIGTGPGQLRPPPLEVDGTVYETQLDRAEALRKATLKRKTAEDDIRDPWAEDLAETIKVPISITLNEATYAAIHVGSTSPGVDNITVDLLQLCWESIGPTVRWLYEGCLRHGHHPGVFKAAEVVMIPKPGKRDLSKPKSWRPISLLSVLGKGLERLIARRISYIAVTQGILHTQQFGALQKRSAVDLVAALIHDLEQALNAGKVATLVTMDIKGAFDAVMRARLTRQLRRQGWPNPLIRWVESFMTGRSACIRLQETTTASKPLNCGLPQGSPVSPILFLLYTEPIYRLGMLDNIPGTQSIKARYLQPASRYGYADDTSMLRIGNTLGDTTDMVTADVNAVLQWGRENGVNFDHEKTEVMHFSRHRNQHNPIVMHEDNPKSAKPSMRWLGIHLDRQLRFKTHVEQWAAKAARVSNILRSVTNTIRGPSPKHTRLAVKACVEPMLLYGAEAWYPGTKIGAKSTGIQHLIHRMHKTYASSLRAIAPVWKTTPLPALYRECGSQPPELLLDSTRRRFAARLQTLDTSHPLAQRSIPGGLKMTRLQRTAASLPKAPRPKLLPKAPAAQTHYKSKKEAAEEFNKWFDFLPSKDTVVFSDGSKTKDGIGWGYSIWRNGRQLAGGSGGLKLAEVFDAEARAALEGLKRALRLTNSQHTTHVCLDNTAAIQGLLGNPSESSQHVFLEFQALAKEHGGVNIHWSPGHMDIEGNETADIYAKRGTRKVPEELPPTLAYVKGLARAKTKRDHQIWWHNNIPEAYMPLNLKATLKCPTELGMERPVLHQLLAARSQHGDFAEYHERFAHDDATITCSCGRRKNPFHIFYCRKVEAKRRPRLAPNALTAIHRIIGTNFQQYTTLAETTHFFTRICPR